VLHQGVNNSPGCVDSLYRPVTLPATAADINDLSTDASYIICCPVCFVLPRTLQRRHINYYLFYYDIVHVVKYEKKH